MKMVKTIEEVYQAAEKFVDENFPDLKKFANKSESRRITILATMKMQIDLDGQAIELRKLGM